MQKILSIALSFPLDLFSKSLSWLQQISFSILMKDTITTNVCSYMYYSFMIVTVNAATTSIGPSLKRKRVIYFLSEHFSRRVVISLVYFTVVNRIVENVTENKQQKIYYFPRSFHRHSYSISVLFLVSYFLAI